MTDPDRLLAARFPEAAAEWHPTRNTTSTPGDVTFGSGLSVWWRCGFGHEWNVRVSDRTKGGNVSGCPVCDDIKNGSVADNATMAAEWDHTLNLRLPPDQTGRRSSIPAAWVCSTCRHRWVQTPNARDRGAGCPACNYTRNGSLAQKHPDLLDEWDWDRNVLDPLKVAAGSDKTAAWICGECGCRWETAIKHRVKGSGCPECANKRRAASRRAAHQRAKKATSN